MENLNAEQVVKALECCANNDECVGEACPYYATGCERNMPKDALSIIKELTEENERLRDKLERTDRALIVMDKAHNKLFTESFKIEADTVRKMKDRLINYESYDNGGGNYVVSVDDIRTVAKEMLEGKDENT